MNNQNTLAGNQAFTEEALIDGSSLPGSGQSYLMGGLCSQLVNPLTDSGSGAGMNVTFMTPDFDHGHIPAGYYFLGHYALKSTNEPPSGSMMLYKAMNDESGNPCFQAPTGYTRIWSKSHCWLNIYVPIAPFGYVAVGCIATYHAYPDANSVPYIDKLMCVRQDLCDQFTLGGADLVWNDHGSGALDCASVFKLPNSKTAWGVADYPAAPGVWDVKKR